MLSAAMAQHLQDVARTFLQAQTSSVTERCSHHTPTPTPQPHNKVRSRPPPPNGGHPDASRGMPGAVVRRGEGGAKAERALLESPVRPPRGQRPGLPFPPAARPRRAGPAAVGAVSSPLREPGPPPGSSGGPANASGFPGPAWAAPWGSRACCSS